MFGFGFAELAVVLGIVLLIFGWGRWSQLGNNFRQAMGNYKLMARGGEDNPNVTPMTSDETSRKEPHHVG
jgi:Sec-independent protein translocase protein TatA